MNISQFDSEELDQSEDDNITDFVVLVVLEVIICITFIAGTILITVLVILFFRRRGFRTLSNRYKKITLHFSLFYSAYCQVCAEPCPVQPILPAAADTTQSAGSNCIISHGEVFLLFHPHIGGHHGVRPHPTVHTPHWY